MEMYGCYDDFVWNLFMYGSVCMDISGSIPRV